MDRVLALIVAASVLMMTSLTVIFVFSDSISSTSQSADDLEEGSICSFQAEQYCSGSAKISQLDQECIRYIENYECSQNKKEKALVQQVRPLITE